MRYGIVILSFILSGCASSVWVGQNPDRDIYECKMETARQYPPALYSQQVGTGYKAPSYTTCNAMGNFASCTTTGGNYTPPPIITSDANEGARNNAFNYCMVQRGNRLMSKSDYQNYKQELSNGETPTQKKIRLREECRSVNGQNSPLCVDQNSSDSSNNNETPTQRKIRLREECRSANGQESPLCIEKINTDNSNIETIDRKKSQREACIKTYGKDRC